MGGAKEMLRAGRTAEVRRAARLGYVATGVINVLIGWIALQLAFGDGSGDADASGALRELAGTPFGAVLLWAVLVGFALLGLWQVGAALLGGKALDRVKDGARGIGYLVLAGLTATMLLGSGGGDTDESHLTAVVMAQPAGRWLVGAVGLGIAAVAVLHVVTGWRATFLEDLRSHPRPWVVHVGRAGYIGRGIALGLVGGLLVIAAFRADPEEAEGLDGALQNLREAPYGPVLLAVVALGFIAFGVYSFARVKYADLREEPRSG